MLTCTNLNLENNNGAVFLNMGFTLLPGSLLVVKGANGSGKTCLLKMIAGLIAYTNGTITWNKINIDDDIHAFRQNLCYIGHDNALKGELTVFDNLQFWCELKNQPELLMPAIHHFHLQNILDMSVGSLSIGWQRKVDLARILLSPTNLWLLDEPEINLDQTGKNLLMDLIKTRVRERGIVIIASHGLNDLAYANYLNIEDFADDKNLT